MILDRNDEDGVCGTNYGEWVAEMRSDFDPPRMQDPEDWGDWANEEED